MTHNVDDDLKSMFNESASTIDSLSPEFTRAVVAEGRRRRRTRYGVAGAAGAAVLALVVAAAWQIPTVFNGGAGPADGSPASSTPSTGAFDSPRSWVGALPRGADASAVYASGTTLHVGERTVPITGAGFGASTQAWIHTRVSTGWLATIDLAGDHYHGRSDLRLGVIADDGAFTPFAYQGENYGMAVGLPPLVSPDETQVLTSSTVVDVVTGEKVATAPVSGFSLAWTDAGIYFLPLDKKIGPTATLWSPGTSATTVRLDPKDCSTMHGVAQQIVAGAGPCVQGLLSLSPSGDSALLASMRVRDVTTGQVSDIVPRFAAALLKDSPSLENVSLWEDDEHVLLAVPTAQPDGGNAVFVLIRCSTSSLTCERASDEVSAAEGFGFTALQWG